MFAVPGVTRKLDWKFKSSKELREETIGRETRRNVNEFTDHYAFLLLLREDDKTVIAGTFICNY